MKTFVKDFLNSDSNFANTSTYWQVVIKDLNINVVDFLNLVEDWFRNKDFNRTTQHQYHATEEYMYNVALKEKLLKDWRISDKNKIRYMAWIWVLSNIFNDFIDYLYDGIEEEEDDCETEQPEESPSWTVNDIWNNIKTQNINKHNLDIEDLNDWLNFARRNQSNYETTELLWDARIWTKQ